MPSSVPPSAPQRPTDVARLRVTKLKVEEGVALETIFERTTEIAADTLALARAGIWLVSPQRRELRCVDLFERATGLHSSGVTLPTDALPDYLVALDARKTIPAEIAFDDARVSAWMPMYLEPLGITSVLHAGIFVGGEIVGLIAFEHIGPPREWTTEDRDFAGSMADLVGLKIRAAEFEEARKALRTQANQLAETRRYDALAVMAAGVAHDFNNVLVTIVSANELILAGIGDVAEYARVIGSSAERGRGLAQQLMAFAHPDARLSRVIRPAEVVSSMMKALQRAAGDRHRVECDVERGGGRVLIAPGQFERIVDNLVLNARDAMPHGGVIRLSVAIASVADDDGKVVRMCVVDVTDQGTGIAPDVLPRIFDPFFTTKPRGQGTGLGLAVVNQIVNHAGGFIRIDTAADRGTTFRIHLPLAGHD